MLLPGGQDVDVSLSQLASKLTAMGAHCRHNFYERPIRLHITHDNRHYKNGLDWWMLKTARDDTKAIWERT